MTDNRGDVQVEFIPQNGRCPWVVAVKVGGVVEPGSMWLAYPTEKEAQHHATEWLKHLRHDHGNV